jgi:Predicted dehydrogenases and related proteins
MSRKKLSVAVIGAGMAGRTHANAWRQVGTVYGTEGIPEIRLATICDAYLAFAESAAANYGYEHATTDWREIAADPDIDIVSIVVANRLHREIAEALIKAGKHVLCEKPLSDTLEDAAAMAEAEADADVVTGIGFGYRRHPSIAEIARLAQDGDLGQVTHFEGRYWCDYGADPDVPIAWRYKGPMGSGALGDVGSHITDLAEFVCGPIKSVNGGSFATVIAKRPPAVQGVAGGRGATTGSEATEVVENDDIATFHITFESGAIGSISVSRVAFGMPNSLAFDVFGTKGRASFDLARSGEILLDDTFSPLGRRGPKQVLSNPDFPYFKGGSSMDFAGVGSTQIEQFTYQARAFLDQVIGLDEGLPPVPTFAHGYRAMRIQDAVARSASAGGSVVDIH